MRGFMEDIGPVFRPVREIAKSDCKFRRAVRSSARNNSAPIDRICMKFGIGGFFENLLKKFKFFFTGQK